MSTTFSGLSKTLRWTLMCGAVVLALGTHAQRLLAQPSAVPSELLSDDERIAFCTQMHRASTPQERSAVTASMRDTLTPRAKGQGVALPSWLLEGRPASEGGSIPGLSCDSGAPRPRVQAAAPAPVPASVPATAREVPERKPPLPRELATREPVPHVPAPATQEPPTRPMPVREQTVANVPGVSGAPRPTLANDDAPVRNTVPGDIPVAHDNHGVAYVTGGVGQDEVAAFRGLASGYNMRATFTTGSGEYLSGVVVQVSRSDGTVVFNATSDGPYLYARLPQGHYRLIASLDGAQRSRDLYVPARGGVKLTLIWPLLHANSLN
jgi:hypothetical protein